MTDKELRRGLLLILLLVAVNLIFVRMGSGGLASYDDAYYAEKAKEMLVHHSAYTVYYDNHPSFDNPPGLFWLIEGSYKIFGINSFGAAFPSALCGLLGILGTFLLFELLFSTRVAFLSGAVLTLTALYLKYSRKSMMDVEVTACTVWFFYWFIKGLRGDEKGFILAGLIGSYSLFMKSVLGIVPAMVPPIYLIATGQWRPFRNWKLWLGVLLLFIPYGSWVFYEYHLFGHQFLQGHYGMIMGEATSVSTNDHFYDYAVTLLKYFPLWLPFMVWGIWIAVKIRGGEAKSYWFPLFYFATYFVLLSAQKTTKDWYFIPAFPACAALAALGLDRALAKWDLRRISRVYAGLGIGFYLVYNMTNIPLSMKREVSTRMLAAYVHAAGKAQFDIVGYDIDFFGLNNALLFYSDYSAKAVNAQTLPAEMSAHSKVAVLVDTSKWDEIKKAHPDLKIVKNTGQMILATNAPLATESIFSFKESP